MKAIGALPPEPRVQQMNDAQWLWFYLNLLEDEKEEEKRWKSRLDYLTWFINPEMAKGVADQEKKKVKKKKNSKDFVNQLLSAAGKQIDGNENNDREINEIREDIESDELEYVDLDENGLEIIDGMPMGTFVNSEFDDLLKQVVNEDDVFIELPDTGDGVGDPNESLEDFVNRTTSLFDAFQNGDMSVFAPETSKQDVGSPNEFNIEDLSHKENSTNYTQINNIPEILDDDIDIIIPDNE